MLEYVLIVNGTMKQTGTNPMTREIAQRLLVYEAAAQDPSEADTSAGFRICQKFGDPLSKLIGADGFRAILERALTLARREAEVLNTVTVAKDGTLHGLNGEAEKVSAVLVAHLYGLVVTFLGEFLTLRLLRDVWPEQIDFDKHSGERSGHERTE